MRKIEVNTHQESSGIEYETQIRLEREIITMLIGDNHSKRGTIINHLNENMFMNKQYRKFFNIIKNLFEQKTIITTVSIMEQLDTKDDLLLLDELSNEYVTSINCSYYITKLQDKYFARSLKKAETEEEFLEIKKEKNSYILDDCLKPISYKSEDILNQYDSRDNEVVTTYPSIDSKIGSLQGGDVMILAGGTGMGKTCMALNLVYRIQKQTKVHIYSLEMTHKQLTNRIICSELGIDSNALRTHSLTDRDYARYKNYSENNLMNLNIDICDKSRMKVSTIYELERDSDAGLIVIDYLGLLTPERYSSRYESVSELSRAVKTMAVEIRKPIILLHQISRKYMERDDKIPKLSDLRDSGSVEQDADFVCFVHRPYKVGDAEVDDHINFIISKNRFGECDFGTSLIFNGRTQKITDQKELLRVVK